MKIFYLANTLIGTPGNIGFRLAKILPLLENEKIDYTIFSRGGLWKKNNFSLPGFGFVSRALNYIRKNHIPKFNSRRWDIYVFNIQFILLIPVVLWRFRGEDNKVAHCFEYSVFCISVLNKLGFKTVLDTPIAPNSYVQELLVKQPNVGLSYFPYLKHVEKRSAELCKVVVSPSFFVKHEFCKLSKSLIDKITVVHFGCDVNTYKRDINNTEQVRYCFAGAISKRKGIDILLQVWKNACFDDCELHLLGKVNKDFSHAFGAKNIVAPGFVDTGNYFKAMDVYVFPSLMEGSSKSIFEAMASGLPVICTNESGSIVDHNGSGLIIDAVNTDALKKAMINLKSHVIRKRMSEKSLDLSSLYTWELYATNVKNIYGSL